MELGNKSENNRWLRSKRPLHKRTNSVNVEPAVESEIYFSSDLHFGHDKDFLYRPRGFTSMIDHAEMVVYNWNNIVKPNDIVYVLGDLIVGDSEIGFKYLEQLNGQLKIIRGNHDTDTRWKLYESLPNIELLGWAEMLKYHKWRFYLSHYPTMIGNFDDAKGRKRYCLCGHLHTQNPFQDMDKMCYHVELDAHYNKPVNIKEIVDDIKDWEAQYYDSYH